jgi:hypothetical protein
MITDGMFSLGEPNLLNLLRAAPNEVFGLLDVLERED